MMGNIKMKCHFGEALVLLLVYSAAKYAESASCGGKLTDPEGNITSPNYPEDYPPGSFCFWEIVAPPTDVIVLEFHDFELEFASKGCDYDYVIMVDGNSELRYCGNDIPDTLRSHGYKLTIGFVTDTNSQHKGFSASYRMVNRFESTTTSTTAPPSTSTQIYEECGGNIYDSGATILSPGYPDAYPDSVVCIWNIQPRFGEMIYLTIDLLDIDDSNQCTDDYLQMLDADLKILGRFCGNVAPSLVIVAKKRITVVFKSDDHVTKRGFKLSYTNQEIEVGSTVTQTFQPTINPKSPITRVTHHGINKTSPASPRTTPTSPRVSRTASSPSPSSTTETRPGDELADKGPSNMKKISIGIGVVMTTIVIIAIIVYFLKRRKQPNRLLSRGDYSNMAPPLTYGSDNMAAKPYPDPDAISNHGYDAAGEADTSKLSEISTPWGTAKRSQLREISPQYFGTGSRPQLGLPETRIEADQSTTNT